MSVSDCPNCGERSPITKTWPRRSDGATLRRRECPTCLESWVTCERLLGDVAENAVTATDLAVLFSELGIHIDVDR
jgi:transcriptional regulator NrdR family protein